MTRFGTGRPGRVLAPLVFVLLIGCGGKGPSSSGSGVTPPPLLPTFKCADSPVMIDQVAMTCDLRISDDIWQIGVVIGSPTTATNIDGFAFDVLFDATRMTYVDGSALAGSLFFHGGPTPLVSAQTKPGEPGRLIVGVHSTGGGGGVQGVAPYNGIVVFRMKRVFGETFDPQLLRFDNMVALDSLDQPIPSIRFSDQLTLSNQ